MLNFSNFISKVFPIRNPFLRKEYPFIFNVIKFFAIRFAYILYRLRVSANVLDVFAILIMIVGIGMVNLSILHMDLLYFLYGFFAISTSIFFDFVDGLLAKTCKYRYRAGEMLDDLSPNIARVASFLIIGLISNHVLFGVLSVVIVVFVNKYVYETRSCILENRRWITELFSRGCSINSIKMLVAIIMPVVSVIYIYDPKNGEYLARSIIIFYFLISSFWLYYSLESKVDQKGLN